MGPCELLFLGCVERVLVKGKRTAMLLLNPNDDNSTDLSSNTSMLNLTYEYTKMAVRDAWERKDLGVFTGSFTAKAVPVHGAVVLMVKDASA